MCRTTTYRPTTGRSRICWIANMLRVDHRWKGSGKLVLASPVQALDGQVGSMKVECLHVRPWHHQQLYIVASNCGRNITTPPPPLSSPRVAQPTVHYVLNRPSLPKQDPDDFMGAFEADLRPWCVEHLIHLAAVVVCTIPRNPTGWTQDLEMLEEVDRRRARCFHVTARLHRGFVAKERRPDLYDCRVCAKVSSTSGQRYHMLSKALARQSANHRKKGLGLWLQNHRIFAYLWPFSTQVECM